jgi:3-keto-disaccharide hydrolase
MFRFIGWLAVGLATASIADRTQAGEWISLFNGKNLDGWQAVEGPMSAWKVEDGLLYCSGGGGGWLSTKDQYENFEIELEFRVPPGGNSGVMLRAPHQGTPAFSGMEIQILDDRAPEYAKLKPYQYCGSLYDLEPPKTRASKPAGEWQKMHITCNGRNVQVSLNGTPIVDANLDEYVDKEATHPGLKRMTGYVGLQNHGTRLDFRNVRLRKLP